MTNFFLFLYLFGLLVLLPTISIVVIITIGAFKGRAALEKKYDLLRNEIAANEGGINKRLSENRELIHLMECQCPQILRKNPWVYGWVDSQEKYLLAIAECVNIPVFSGINTILNGRQSI